MAYTINNATLEWVNSYKYLGIRITSHLRWSEQRRDAASKAMKILNLLRRTMHGTSTEAKKRAFVMLVRPHLEYAAPVWSPHVQRDIETLEHVQRRAAHWICSKWDRTNRKWSKTYEEAQKELSWPSIRDRHIFLTFCQIFKIIHSLDCINFDSYLSYSSRPSRSHNQTFRCVPSRLNCYRFSFLGPYIYISVTKWRRSGFHEFTKLLFALSSFAQPFDRIRSIQEHIFIILSHRQACAGRFREETAGKRRGPVTKWPPWSRLFTRLEIVFVIISSFTKRTKVVHE